MSGENGLNREEKMIMKLTILIIIGVLGVAIPLLWLTGSLASFVYFCRRGFAAIRKERAVALNPQLGLTMADGGDSIDEEKKG